MKIKINFKEKKEMEVKKLTFDTKVFGEEEIIREAIQPGTTIIELEEADIRAAYLLEMELVDLSTGEERSFAEIDGITVECKEGSYTFPEFVFSKFQKMEIPVFGDVTKEVYNILAVYFRKQEKINNAVNALENFEAPKNIEASLLRDINNLAEEFDAVTDYTGEEEYYTIEEIIRKRGPIVYPTFISGDSIQLVPMFKSDFQNCQKWFGQWSGEKNASVPEEWQHLCDEEGNPVDFKNLVEIKEKMEFSPEASALNYLERCCLDMGDNYYDVVGENCDSLGIFFDPDVCEENREYYTSYKSKLCFEEVIKDERLLQRYLSSLWKKRDSYLKLLCFPCFPPVSIEEDPIYQAVKTLEKWSPDFGNLINLMNEMDLLTARYAFQLSREYFQYLDPNFFSVDNVANKVGSMNIEDISYAYEISPEFLHPLKTAMDKDGIKGFFYRENNVMKVVFFYFERRYDVPKLHTVNLKKELILGQKSQQEEAKMLAAVLNDIAANIDQYLK